MKLVTCKKCGWVHMQVSRIYAEDEVKKFNTYFDSLSKKEQETYYSSKKSSIRIYEVCNLCGTCYHNFRRFKDGDCPTGCTIGPIINKKD